jgi:hypothetical protein
MQPAALQRGGGGRRCGTRRRTERAAAARSECEMKVVRMIVLKQMKTISSMSEVYNEQTRTSEFARAGFLRVEDCDGKMYSSNASLM